MKKKKKIEYILLQDSKGFYKLTERMTDSNHDIHYPVINNKIDSYTKYILIPSNPVYSRLVFRFFGNFAKDNIPIFEQIN